MFHVPERFRITKGLQASNASFGNNGAFYVDVLRNKRPFWVIASDGGGWEHVSISLPGAKKCPSWEVMVAIKDMFWDPGDMVIQFHPPEADYVNIHPYTLHLWRKAGTNDFVETPPLFMV